MIIPFQDGFIPTIARTNQGIVGNWDGYPYYYVRIASDDKLWGVSDFNGTPIICSSNAVVSATTWYHFAYVVDSSGNATLYLNGTAQTDARECISSCSG